MNTQMRDTFSNLVPFLISMVENLNPGISNTHNLRTKEGVIGAIGELYGEQTAKVASAAVSPAPTPTPEPVKAAPAPAPKAPSKSDSPSKTAKTAYRIVKEALDIVKKDDTNRSIAFLLEDATRSVEKSTKSDATKSWDRVNSLLRKHEGWKDRSPSELEDIFRPLLRKLR